MESSLHRLLPLFERERAADHDIVLATVLGTAGSTYRKAGAQMLIALDGEFAGLLSGGCLEGDLREHAREILSSGRPQRVRYDMRDTDDPVFGLGSGCEGAMDIIMQRVGAAQGWQPFTRLADSLQARRPDALAIVVESALEALPVGSSLVASANASIGTGGEKTSVLRRLDERTARAADESQVSWFIEASAGLRAFISPLVLPPRILVLGGGPDAVPVVDLAAMMGWHVVVVDHRPVYAEAARFPRARRVVCARPETFDATETPDAFVAAIVMSHHLESDLHYLRRLAVSRIPYVGLLGPAARRERLLRDLGAAAGQLRNRLRAPIGLDIGAHTPEAIAVAIVAEVSAALESRDGRPFSATV
ncbi:MAG: XdhC family protein [Steroidobacteraceae bacterium]